MKPNRELVMAAIERIANGRSVRIDRLLEILAVEIPTDAELDRMAASQEKLIASLTDLEREVVIAYSEAAVKLGKQKISRSTRGKPSSASKN